MAHSLPMERVVSTLATPTFLGHARTQATLRLTRLPHLWTLISSAPIHNSSLRNGPKRASRFRRNGFPRVCVLHKQGWAECQGTREGEDRDPVGLKIAMMRRGYACKLLCGVAFLLVD